MGVDLLAKYQGENSRSSLDPANSGTCFRLGDKPAKYVYFREAEGKFAAFAYLLLQSLQYDPAPEQGLVLHFARTTVTIKGLNLQHVSQSFLDHLVEECLVGDERQGKPAGVPFVTRIEIDFE